MADLIIPAVIRTWLIFLIAFFLLGYPVPFSIMYGAVGGLAGGIVTGWWQMKDGAPNDPKRLPPPDQTRDSNSNGHSATLYFELPFLKTKADRRYIERRKRAHARRLRK